MAGLLGLQVRVGRRDGLQGVGRDLRVELGELARLGDEALVGLLGVIRLNLDRGLDAAGAEQLLDVSEPAASAFLE